MLLLNRYEYNPQTDIAGRGAVSRVYKAIDKETATAVAVKIYKIDNDSTQYHAINGIQELLTLEHPALCRYLAVEVMEREDSFGEKEKLQACVTDFVTGINLVAFYSHRHVPSVLLSLTETILNALAYLQKKNHLHGNIKPSNLLVYEADELPAVKLCDFGGTFKMNEQVAASLPLAAATPYVSPEQLQPARFGINGTITANTDLWSLGVVLYEALTGNSLFGLNTTDFADTLPRRIMSFEMPSDVEALPAPFNKLLPRCLVKDASQRAQGADDLLAIINDFLSTDANLAGLQTDLKGSIAVNDADDTRIIKLPADSSKTSDENTSSITTSTAKIEETLPAEEIDQTKFLEQSSILPSADPDPLAPDEDATAFYSRSAMTQASEDDTKVLGKIIQANIDDNVEVSANDDAEATRFFQKPNLADGTPTKEDQDADTKMLQPGTANAAQPSTAAHANEDEEPIDRTIIISKINKDEVAAKQDNAAPAKTPDILIKRREKPVVLFNRYEYLPATDLIGKGGFSRVYKAFDKKLSRWVALKIYKTGEFSDRYSPIAEIKRVVNLDHSNICRYLDIEEIENENPFGENEKIQVCVMELLDSGNFAEYYRAHQDFVVLKKLVQDILNGLSYLHKNGIIHRDIKPANILIKQTIEGPVAKITDFGISKNSEADNNNSSSALVVSIPYMAPEQLNAKKYGINEKVSYNLDLWSLGVTIYEVVTGKVLFKNSEQDNSEQIMANIMAPGLPEKLKDLPEPFKTVVSHCVIKNARERASRAEELMVLLNSSALNMPATESLAVQAANTTVETPVTVLPAVEIPKPEVQETRNTTIVAQKPIAHRFAMEDNPETAERSDIAQQPQKEDDKTTTNKTLLMVISSAAVLFVLFFIYLKACDQPVVPNGNAQPLSTDTAKHPSTPLKDVSHDNTAKAKVPPAVSDSLADDTEEVAIPKEKKKATPATETRHKQTTNEDKPATGNPEKYTALLAVEQNCTLKVNNIPYGDIQSGKPLRIYLTPGKYLLQFTSSSNPASTYTANIEVKPSNLGHADKFRIPLK